MSNSKKINIKKYPNRRMYDATNSQYVNLANIEEMVKDNIDFQVIDTASGDDITRQILTQILLEKEVEKNNNFLPTEFLKILIQAYGSSYHHLMQEFMKNTLQLYKNNFQNMTQMHNMPDISQVGNFMGQNLFENFQNMQKNMMDNPFTNSQKEMFKNYYSQASNPYQTSEKTNAEDEQQENNNSTSNPDNPEHSNNPEQSKFDDKIDQLQKEIEELKKHLKK